MVRITFRIHYHTQWGQEIVVAGDIPELGNGDPSQGLLLQHRPGGYWEGSFIYKEGKPFQYQYALLEEGTASTEWGLSRSCQAAPATDLVLVDTWRAAHHPENPCYTSAFLQTLFKQTGLKASASNPASGRQVTFQMVAPRVPEGMQLGITGDQPELGAWGAKSVLLMSNEKYPVWSVSLSVPSELEQIQYKYCLVNTQTGAIQVWETGANRKVKLPAGNTATCVTDEYFAHPGGYWKGAGVAVPVFSLRSDKSLGVGEFTDLHLLVDWAKSTGLHLIQILPVNDTVATHTWTDSYPYAAISVYALHPIYLNLDELLPAKRKAPWTAERLKLNALPQIDYEAVMKAKLAHARKLFDSQWESFLAGAPFKAFFASNEHWLPAYAAFCHLRDLNGTVDFSKWEEAAVFSTDLLSRLTANDAPHFKEIAFYYYLQFHLDRQLRAAADYARSEGIVLKGDIPIGIYRYSLDAWTDPELYNMDGQSGAPPDPFADKGQNWGFPTYNWERMAEDGYQWWRSRLQQLSGYFDAFRIDHILGFFRIWQIPIDQVEGILGHFNPALPLHLEEFQIRNIPFDKDRFCKPYLPDYWIDGLFAEDAALVKKEMLEPDSPGLYKLKRGFTSQQEIDSSLSKKKWSKYAHLKEKLFDLVSNVLLLEVPASGGKQFHPRFNLHLTRSFQDLPPDVRGKLHELYIDYFYRRQETFWEQQAMKKLPAIKSATDMLICGEDLGMVPACVPGVMKDLSILSLEIQRMSKNPATEFLKAGDIPYWSVCSPSTHDMAPIRSWWEEMTTDQRQRFYQDVLGVTGQAPPTCEPWIADLIIRQHLQFPSMWAIFPLQDLLAVDGQLRHPDPHAERINVPAITPYYWRYRFHIKLEDLLAAKPFNQHLRMTLVQCNRLG